MNNIKTFRYLQKALLRAKHEEQVVSLLDENSMLLNEEGGGELLWWALQHNRPHVVKALVQRGVNIKAATVGGKTALQWAAYLGHEKMARLLLEQGADITNKGSYGATPLLLALDFDMKLVKLLLEYMGGQGLEERDVNDRTALAVAASGGLVEVVSLLLDQKADPGVRGSYQETPLMLAAQRGDAKGLRVVKLLLKHLQAQDIDARGIQGRTALHFACTPTWGQCHSECDGIVKALLLAGADPIIRNHNGTRPRAIAEDCYDPWIRAKLVAAFEWWEREPERRFLLHKARCLSNVCSPVACLEARVGAGQDLPCVEVASQEGGNGKRKRVAREEQGQEEERHAVVEYVVEGLSEELFIELMQGFYLDHAY